MYREQDVWMADYFSGQLRSRGSRTAKIAPQQMESSRARILSQTKSSMAATLKTGINYLLYREEVGAF
jgi:hypothetical protein